MSMSKKNSIGVLCAVVMIYGLLGTRSVEAAPPAKYDVGSLVFIDFSANPSHLIQFPGAPTNFNCTDTFNSDWCLRVNCNTVSSSTYDCSETVPISIHVCLAFQISGGQIIKIINVDSDGCK